jgi:hypothetical protein
MAAPIPHGIMPIDLPAGMDGEPMGKGRDGPGKGVHAVVLTRVPRMARAGVSVALEHHVQGRSRLKSDGQRIANPLPVRQAPGLDIQGRAQDEDVIDVPPLGAAIPQAPVHADGPRLPAHEEVEAIDGVLITVGIAAPPFGAMGLDLDQRLEGQAREADRAQVDHAQGRRAILQPHPHLPEARLMHIVRALIPPEALLHLGIRVHASHGDPQLQVREDPIRSAEGGAIAIQPPPREIVASAEIRREDLLTHGEQPHSNVTLAQGGGGGQIAIARRPEQAGPRTPRTARLPRAPPSLPR